MEAAADQVDRKRVVTINQCFFSCIGLLSSLELNAEDQSIGLLTLYPGPPVILLLSHVLLFSRGTLILNFS